MFASDRRAPVAGMVLAMIAALLLTACGVTRGEDGDEGGEDGEEA